MSEQRAPRELSAPRDQSQETPGTQVERLATSAMQREINAARQTQDLEGRACRTQPAPGEIPVLYAGGSQRGCEYQSPRQVEQRSGVLNVSNIWDDIRRTTVRIPIEGRQTRGSGSGVIIGENNNQCLVLTSAHVVRPERFGEPSERLVSRGATMPDGRTYPAEVRYSDTQRDRAVIAVHTGDRTSQLCTPARFAEDPSRRGPTLTAGYPLGSENLYLSPGESSGVRRSFTDPSRRQRTSPEIWMVAQTHGGNSGGPIRNAQGEVIGILSRGPSPHEPGKPDRTSIGEPVSAAQVNRYLEIVRAQAAAPPRVQAPAARAR